MKPFSIYIVGDIERRSLFNDIESTAIALQFTLTGTEGLYLFAILVIDFSQLFVKKFGDMIPYSYLCGIIEIIDDVTKESYEVLIRI